MYAICFLKTLLKIFLAIPENSEGKTSALDLRQPEFYDQLSRYKLF